MRWMKMIGAADEMLEDEWLNGRYDLADRVRFPENKRPTGVSRGEPLVLYAAGWERIFAIAVVTSYEPDYDPQPGEERWPWVLGVRLPLAVPRLRVAPTLRDLGVASTSVRQQSHIKLSEAEYERALELLMQPVRP